jgi:putative ABC transport system permease protein
MGPFLRRFVFLFQRRHLSRDLDDELAFHLTMRKDDHVRQGMAPADADLTARRQFGHILRTKEHARDAWVVTWLESLLQDARFALRALRRSPGFAGVIVAVLAVGIGGTVAIFSVVNAVLLRPLPFKDSDRVVFLHGNAPVRSGAMTLPVRSSELPLLRQESQTLSNVSALFVREASLNGVGEGGSSARTLRASISSAAFELFDQRPLIGRGLEPRDEEPGAEQVLVLSHGAWQRLFAGAIDVLGRRIALNGFPHMVVGVMPEGFSFPTPDVEMWSAWSPASGNVAAVTIARLNDGVSLAAATAETNALFDALFVRITGMSLRPNSPPRLKLTPIKEQMVAPVRSALLVMFAAIGLVLLIACSNIATLLLARAAGRRREIGIRSSLGASRGRVAQQVLTESFVLGLSGGVAGMMVAFGFVRLLPALGLTYIPRLGEVKVDGAFLLAVLATTLVTILLFGCAPVLRMIGPRFAQTARSATGFSASSAPSLGRNRTRAALTVVQVALAVMLLVGAGLLGGSFIHLARFDLGYDPDKVLTFAVPMSPAQYSEAEQRTTYAQILDRLHAATLASAAMTGRLPTLPGGTFGGLLHIPGLPERVPTQLRPVSRGYFDVLRLPIVEGRGFDDTDRPGQGPAVIVSRQLAAAFPGGRVLDQTVQVNGPFEGIRLRVVGVAGDVVASSVEAVVRPDMYMLVDQVPTDLKAQGILRSASFVLRVDGDPLSLVPTIRGVVRQIDSRLSVENVSPLRDLVSATVVQPRVNAILLGLFAAIAVLLTAIGIYGLIAYIVSERTQEIGVRMAVGADWQDVLALMLGQSALLVLPGIGFGLAGAAALTRYLESMLYGLTPLDARTFIVVPVAVIAVMFVASYLPARRATRIDPVAALRCE